MKIDSKPGITNYIVVILPGVLTVFAIFFLIMPRVRENRRADAPAAPAENQVTQPTANSFSECESAGYEIVEEYPRQCITPDGHYFVSDEPMDSIGPTGMPSQLLGGDRDEHGCIGSAGYLWCELKSRCLRPWEEKCE